MLGLQAKKRQAAGDAELAKRLATVEEELAEAKRWRSQEEASCPKDRGTLVAECEELHRELASAQERMLGNKRDAKRLQAEHATAVEEVEELQARMEDALAEIDDLREVIALQEQLEFEADAMNEVSASGLAGILEERDGLLQRVVDLEAALGEEAELERAHELGMGSELPRRELVRRAQLMQEELQEARQEKARGFKRARLALDSLGEALTRALRSQPSPANPLTLGEAHRAWEDAAGDLERDIEAVQICVNNGAAEVGGAAIEAALGSLRAHLEKQRDHARECRCCAEAAWDVGTDPEGGEGAG